MRFILLSLLFLPIAEIIGFVTIGGEIGLGSTILWLSASTFFGFQLLRTNAWSKINRSGQQDFFAVADLFNGLSTVIAGILLIFPGFISDFIAIPFLLAPCRQWMFQSLKANPNSFARRQADDLWEKHGQSRNITIEGSFKKVDDDHRQIP